MINLLMVYLCALAFPLLFSSWRVALLGLSAQGIILGVILHGGHGSVSGSEALEYLNFWIVRTCLVPFILFRQMRRAAPLSNFFLIPPNFVQWMVTGSLIAMSYMFGERLSPNNDVEAVHIGTATASILVGMLILSNQTQPIGQVIGLLTIEQGFALVELLSQHPMPVAGHIGVSLIFLLLLLVCGYFVRRLHASGAESAGDDLDGGPP